MHSIKSYLERRSDEELRGMLCAYCNGCASFDAETVLTICEVLYNRSSYQIDPREAFRRLCLRYTQ